MHEEPREPTECHLSSLIPHATGINWVQSPLPDLTALCILHSHISPSLLDFNTIYQYSFLLSCLSLPPDFLLQP